MAIARSDAGRSQERRRNEGLRRFHGYSGAESTPKHDRSAATAARSRAFCRGSPLYPRAFPVRGAERHPARRGEHHAARKMAEQATEHTSGARADHFLGRGTEAPCLAREARLRVAAGGGARRPGGARSIAAAATPCRPSCVRIGRPAGWPAAATAAVRRRHGDPGRGGDRGAHRPAASRNPALAPWRQLLHFRFQCATARQRQRRQPGQRGLPSRNGEAWTKSPPAARAAAEPQPLT
jgi:hypothetical protein